MLNLDAPNDKRLSITSCHENICEENKAKENENRKSRVHHSNRPKRNEGTKGIVKTAEE